MTDTAMEEGAAKAPNFPPQCPRCGSEIRGGHRPLLDHGIWTTVCLDGHLVWEIKESELRCEPTTPSSYRYALLSAHFRHHHNIHLRYSDIEMIDKLTELAKDQP